MPNLGIPLNADGARAISGVIWETMKASIPDSCFAGQDEKLNFAAFGRKRGDNMEMSGMNQAQGAEGADGQPLPPGQEGVEGMSLEDIQRQEAARKLQRDGSMGSSSLAAQAEGPTDLITEWQAGWNVTNAIQVIMMILIIK